MYKSVSTRVVRFCAEECTRQKETDPMSVANMVDAYNEALTCWRSNTSHIEPWLIRHMASMILPDTHGEYRNYPVTIDNVAVPFAAIEDNIEKLCGLSAIDYTPETAKSFYFYFEAIHPFTDGNGRIGAILFNWINGTLFEPIEAPSFHAVRSY